MQGPPGRVGGRGPVATLPSGEGLRAGFRRAASGDGRGSSGLRIGLATPGAKKLPYFEFSPDSVDSNGNVRNPGDFEKLIHYAAPGLHNPKGFDLWCEDSKGRPDGINNWGN